MFDYCVASVLMYLAQSRDLPCPGDLFYILRAYFSKPGLWEKAEESQGLNHNHFPAKRIPCPDTASIKSRLILLRDGLYRIYCVDFYCRWFRKQMGLGIARNALSEYPSQF